jgi:hypothetical protein
MASATPGHRPRVERDGSLTNPGARRARHRSDGPAAIRSRRYRAAWHAGPWGFG